MKKTITVDELIKSCDLTLVAGKNGTQNEILHGFCCDLLSEVMGSAQEKSAWITVQGHQNIIAVAHLGEFAAVIITGGHQPDEDTVKKADEENIPLLLFKGSSFELNGLLYEMGVR